MIHRLLPLFHRRRRWPCYRADYDTGQAATYYGPINWELLRQRAEQAETIAKERRG